MRDYSWMLQSVVDRTPDARHLVLLSADGIAQGATQGLDHDAMNAIASTAAGLQSLSRATGTIVGAQEVDEWRQTLIEFDHGWVFILAAGKRSYLAAAAGPDVDMELISSNMQQLVTRLGRELTAEARTESSVPQSGYRPQAGAQQVRQARVLPRLNDIVDAVPLATQAILVRPDGLPGGASAGMAADVADSFAAAMHALQGLSKSTAPFLGRHVNAQLRQTVVEFDHGWLVTMATPDGGTLAAAAEPDGDIGALAIQMRAVVPEPAEMARNA
ncbi:roadblock/LC7 domain-containing protein [Actinacidiphila acidipaludis]|uniref:Roadblock/LC7 domain-containing protein n=1 Tax=Actinacidiphila acidipaludis TaxID=2873382 RepID=A0ABS7QCG7_9ACTN|nr:roadblock/LC7 domain-containing protein [Streptomyces acidipaludis]MBY8880870.1 roadblock/LC7 domain-containing protein [Streptomyces acidipaludis]